MNNTVVQFIGIKLLFQLHDSRLAHVPGAALMQQTAVVPDHGVTDRPLVMVDPGCLAGELDQLVKQLRGIVICQSGDAIGVAPNGQRWPTGFGVNLHQGTQGRVLVVKTIAAVVAHWTEAV